jgi:proteasome lid subunit RPN8/RPN11
MDMPAFVRRHSRVRMSRAQWSEMTAELGRRAGGIRESGAFLLANVSDGRPVVRRVVYFDDLDPASLNGGVSLNSAAFAKLWRLASSQELHVIADVHTHPANFVHQSAIDLANPMVAMAGHVAIVVPHLAARRLEPSDCGVHVYLGNHQWRESLGRQALGLLYVGRWA